MFLPLQLKEETAPFLFEQQDMKKTTSLCACVKADRTKLKPYIVIPAKKSQKGT